MRVGIYTRYLRHAVTYAALRVADHLQAQGHDVSVFTDDRTTTATCQTWDAQVIRQGPHGYTAWGSRQDAIIWGQPPNPAQVSWAKSVGKQTTIIACGTDTRGADRKVLRLADNVICTSRHVSEVLKARWKLRRCYPVPWDCGWPITTKVRPHDRLRLLLPTEFCYPSLDLAALSMLAAVLERYGDQVEASITYIPSRWQSHASRVLKRMETTFKGRVKLLRSVPYAELPLHYQRHDLTVWPSYRDDYGLAGVCSLTMGTPVLTFDTCPMNEVVDDKTGILVPCPTTLTELGLPNVELAPVRLHEKMLTTLGAIVEDPTQLRRLYAATAQTITTRRASFGRAWKMILPA